MPDSAQAAALSEATHDVLETMFFSEVLSEAPGVAAGCADSIETRLAFKGQQPGEFRLVVGSAAARTIAVDFLGLEDPTAISEAQIGDVTCELANMICGSVLSRLASGVAFELTHPSIVPAAAAVPWPDEAARTFELGTGRLITGIRFEQRA